MVFINVYAADALLIGAVVAGLLSYQEDAKHPKIYNGIVKACVLIAMFGLSTVPFIDKKLSDDKTMWVYAVASIFAGLTTIRAAHDEDGLGVFYGLALMITLSVGINIQYFKVMKK